jgi:hypothetical protein
MNQLSDKYRLWFHKVNNDDWSDKSYIDISNDINGMKTIEDFWGIYNQINTITAGMFFLMKNDIQPKWECPDNINGGYWPFKVFKKDADRIWTELSAALSGNTITLDPQKSKALPGISVSPKINNCIFKIWSNDARITDPYILNTSIDGVHPSAAYYKKHVDNVKNDKK